MKALQSEKVAKLWTFIAAAGLGKYFIDHPKQTVREMWFSDVADMKARPARYAVLQLSVAKVHEREFAVFLVALAVLANQGNRAGLEQCDEKLGANKMGQHC